MLFAYLIATVLFALQETTQPEATIPIRNWRTPVELDSVMAEIASSTDEVTIMTIGASLNGQPIRCIQIARDGLKPAEDRSAILIVAGIDGDYLLGSEVAVDMIEELLSRNREETKQLLEDHLVFIIPQVNPDAAALFFASVQNGYRRNMRATDTDHDGETNEDGVEDLNGDGLITMMRVPDLEKATHLTNPDEPRLNITPDALDGQAAAFVLYTEGIDNDGDGKYNEDGLGGVDLNKNFMHGYTYHGDGAGHWQLSESESKALADFVLKHQEIAAIVVYGQHDTLSKPFAESGKDKAGAPKQLDSGDVEMYKKVSEKFVELTDLKDVDQPNWDGSFVAWAYAQYGVPAFSTPLWTRPEPTKEDTDSEGLTQKGNEVDSTDEASPRNRGSGGVDRQAMMAEFDGDGDGELSDDERTAMRAAMRERFGGGRGEGNRGGRRGGGHFGERSGGATSPSKPSNTGGSDSNLTPSGIGDISQETLDELLQAAEAAGFPVTEEMMAEITPERVEQYAKMSGIEIRRIKSGKKNEKSSSSDVAWLAYSDEQRNGDGFVEWTTFVHPELGTVEIGGWVPYFKTVPPTDVIKGTTITQADFLIDLARKLPDVHLGSPTIKKLGNNLWEVRVAVTNDGWFPTGTAMAKRNKRARPYVVRLEVPNETIVSGQKVNRIWSLSGGGTHKWYKWILQGKPNSDVKITLFSEKFGSESILTSLQNTNGGDE